MPLFVLLIINIIAMQQRVIVKFFRESDQSKGDVYFLRSGNGGGDPLVGLLDASLAGEGRGVSKVK